MLPLRFGQATLQKKQPDEPIIATMRILLVEHQPEESGTMLRALFGTNGQEEVITENISNWQLFNVYAVPAGLLQKIKQQYQNAHPKAKTP